MKLIIKQYLASLQERDALDTVIPDLLSQLGLNVFSRPGQGTRQDGVDVAAVGSLDGQSESVYLFSIKRGDLTRKLWDEEKNPTSPRRSLNEILDAYIPNRLPNEHKGKNIVICLCFGGDIKEDLRCQIKGYMDRQIGSHPNITFIEWNGDKLAQMILENFLHENLFFTNEPRSQLRKSLAFLDKPEISYRYFRELIYFLANNNFPKDDDRLTTIRQMNICLWILFSWSREEKNIESAYLSGELTLLHAWEIAKQYMDKKTNFARDMQYTFISILGVYQQICDEYLAKILPHVEKKHALSNAVQSHNAVDVNLKLFDILGRLAMQGIWVCWIAEQPENQAVETQQPLLNKIEAISIGLIKLISNNPTLFLPFKDDQAIDISIALLFLMRNSRNHNDMKIWLNHLISRVIFAYETHRNYPCNIRSYSDLIEHPQQSDIYRQEVTSASILYPTIGLWAIILGDNDLYEKIKSAKQKNLEHCDFQFWYPDETSEMYFYKNEEIHGALLLVNINQATDAFFKQVFDECEKIPYFKTMSAVKSGLWPIIFIGCRHYRYPLPMHLIESLRKNI